MEKNLKTINENLIPLIFKIGEFNKLEKMNFLNITVDDNIDNNQFLVTLVTVRTVRKKVLEEILLPFLEELKEEHNLIVSHRVWGSRKEFDLSLI